MLIIDSYKKSEGIYSGYLCDTGLQGFSVPVTCVIFEHTDSITTKKPKIGEMDGRTGETGKGVKSALILGMKH